LRISRDIHKKLCSLLCINTLNANFGCYLFHND
ncbi:hypothetical protein T4C_2001, partial [Trichinella pseudospiralis]